jgi:glucan phosphoethanolaminetransferase (alkaline phosphatase superfamily)
MLTLSDPINLKKTEIEKKTISQILLITASILILLVPDVLINDDQNILNFGFSMFSKICLFIFLSSITLRLTRSYFWTYLIIGIPYLISSLIESINIIILNHHITADNIVSLLNASMGEIKEFSNGFYPYFSIPVVLIITYVFILRKYRSISYNVRDQKRIIILGLIAIVISLSISFFKVLHSDKIYSGKNLTKFTLRSCYLGQHPFNLLNESYVFAKIKLRAYRYKAQHDNFKFGILNPTDTVKPKIVVFIIGERTRYSNWSINGYARETSPNLEKIANLISFNKHYSNSNFTYGSIPLIITQATPKTPNVAYSQKSIVSLFKEAGYETSWISSQYLFDIIDERKVPDYLYELYKKKHTDMDILPLFDSVINRKSTKNKLILINMIGGHGEIPERFDQFKPNSTQGNYPVTMGNAPLFINSYDNQILLQDYVISELIKRTKKQNVSSVLLFTADHGCNLFDNGKALFGYGSANPTEKETHIPMFISLSNKFIENNHEKYKNLSNHKNLLTTNNNLFYTLADLANIKYKSFIKKQSISDSSFVEPSSRFVYINGTIFEFKK